MEQVAPVLDNSIPSSAVPAPLPSAVVGGSGGEGKRNKILPVVLILISVVLLLSGVLVFSVSKLGIFSPKKQEQEVADVQTPTPSELVVQPALGKDLSLKEASIQAKARLAESLLVSSEDLIIGVTGNSSGFYLGTAKLSKNNNAYWWVAANKEGFLVILKTGEGKALCDDLTSVNVPPDLLTDCN